MPSRPLRPCLEPGCPTLTSRSRCAVHERTSTRNHGGVPAARRGYDAEYRRARAEAIAAQPWCSECGSSFNLTADHVVPLSQGGDPHGLLRVLCKACNSAQGARLAAGEGRVGSLGPRHPLYRGPTKKNAGQVSHVGTVRNG